MERKRRFFTLDDDARVKEKLSANLKVIGVGGGGCNAVDFMINRGLKGVEYIAINTDSQVLEVSKANKKMQIGTNITRGLGAGADPDVGKKAIEENKDELKQVLAGSDMVFITAGMGGGTGTGAAAVVAEEAKSIGALVVGVVTEPFAWEGKQRMRNASEGIAQLKKHVDSLIVVPNNRLLNNLENVVSAADAFAKPNEVLLEATQGIADIITIRGVINVDFADVRKVMNSSGKALMGRGIARGENRAIEAAEKAISSPLLEGMSIKGAKKVLLNVTGSSNLRMSEIDLGNKVINEAVGEEADIIFGWVVKEDMEETVSYTVIATGFETNEQEIKIPTPQIKTPASKEKSKLGGVPSLFGDLEEESTWSSTGVPSKEFVDTDFNQQFNSIEEEEIEKERVKNKNKKDSASFLRMIMD